MTLAGSTGLFAEDARVSVKALSTVAVLMTVVDEPVFVPVVEAMSLTAVLLMELICEDVEDSLTALDPGAVADECQQLSSLDS